MSSLKRLKVDETRDAISWKNPKYADWKLTWSSCASLEGKSWDVHRCILAGGPRAANFFVGAAREGAYNSQSTELSVLLPQACMEYVEQVLDFIYGEPLGEVAAKDVIPLLKIADVLQCPTLQNELIDFIDAKGLIQQGTVETLLKDACGLELFEIAETLVNILPLSRLATLDFDLLKFDNVDLMRAVGRRLAQAKMTQWGFFVGHGQASADGSIALTLPSASTEKSRKGYWCHALSLAEVVAGRHTWKLRIDHVPGDHSNDWNMIVGVFSSPSPVSTTSCLKMAYSSNFEGGAYIDFGAGGWNLCCNHAVAGIVGRIEKKEDGIRVPISDQKVRRGDVLSLSINLADGKSRGDIEWCLNGNVVGSLQSFCKPAPYRLGVEIGKFIYEADSMGMTLLSHTNA